VKRYFRKKINNQKIFFVFVITFLVMIACTSTDENTKTTNTLTSDTTFMNVYEINFPEAPGADAFKANCLMCHSARYVEMQPGFSRTAWEKIVSKMVKNYGAPIADSTAKIIVDYITTFKGENKIAAQ
jgi:hypothetical protein